VPPLSVIPKIKPGIFSSQKIGRYPMPIRYRYDFVRF
jgi:hypothetical protein